MQAAELTEIAASISKERLDELKRGCMSSPEDHATHGGQQMT